MATRNVERIKIGPNGEQLPADATDHVAVHLLDQALIVHPYSLGSPNGEPLRNWQACVEACAALRVLGYDDWELATRPDWNHILDLKRFNPAVDTNLYPGIKPRWHWTASHAAWEMKDAAGRSASTCSVSAGGGLVYYFHRSSRGFALAVRRVGQ